MEIQVAVICDSASDYQGKLCVLGTFDTIMAGSAPVTHPHCAVALRVVFKKDEEGPHQLRLNIIDADGHEIVPAIQGELHVRVPDGVYFISANMVINIQQLQFKEPGMYAIDVVLDGRQIASLPLQVRLAQQRG